MTTQPAPNSRAALLAGLRTGGVRSTSATVPHTAAPGATFSVPRFASQHHAASSFPEEEEEDQVLEIPQQSAFAAHNSFNRTMPMTAAVDGPTNRFATQQLGQRGLNPHSLPFSPAAFNSMMTQQQAQTQALQMQMQMLEIMRYQTMQAQAAEMMAQAQLQQAQAQSLSSKRLNTAMVPPATAGPLNNSFDLRSATLNAQMRRANAENLRSQYNSAGEDHLPMTAALGGKFGSRTVSLNAAQSAIGRMTMDDTEDLAPPSYSGTTTVISGGTSLGTPTSATPSKSDSASSWRRTGNHSVLSANRVVSSPTVKVTPPPRETQHVSPPPAVSSVGSKFRPQPLRFNPIVSQPLPSVTVDTSPEDEDASSSSSAASNSSPTTPQSSSSNGIPLSPREEATKKLYEGLGIGRPTPAATEQTNISSTAVASHRMTSQPMRQPRGPPSGVEELGPKNFATRIRRKAIGGLGMLMGARERREIVEAY